MGVHNLSQRFVHFSFEVLLVLLRSNYLVEMELQKPLLSWPGKHQQHQQ